MEVQKPISPQGPLATNLAKPLSCDLVEHADDDAKLKPLPLVEGAERIGWLYVMYADRDATGPGVRRIAELLHEAARTDGQP